MARLDFKKKPSTDFKDIDRLSQEEARAEIEALREGINYHDYLYYVKNQPKISDETYDKLFHRLQELEEAFPEFQSESFFGQKENRKVLEALLDAGVEVKDMPKLKEQPLQGKTFVFTGKLKNYTREEAKEKVEVLGGRSTSNVSGETDYLVLGGGPGQKLEEAKEQKVKIIDAEEFEKLVAG